MATKRVMFLGDSETVGQIGVDFTQFLKEGIEPVREAHNGATIKGVFEKHLIPVIADTQYDDIEDYVLFMGVNDAWIPWVSSLNDFWAAVSNREGEVVSHDPDEFEAVYRECLDTLAVKGKNIIMLGCPVVQVNGFPHEELIPHYNKILEALAEEYGATFIDTYALQMKLLEKPLTYYEQGPGIFPGSDRLVVMTLQGMHPELKDEVSALYGLELTVDGIHLNSKSAKAIAAAINEVI